MPKPAFRSGRLPVTLLAATCVGVGPSIIAFIGIVMATVPTNPPTNPAIVASTTSHHVLVGRPRTRAAEV
jgi:hypothetical protein